MFIGHIAVGLAAKRFAPRTSLGTLVAAPLLLDLLWPFLLLTGLEQVRIVPGITAFSPLDFVRYPYTHSLVMALGWAILFAALYRVRSGQAVGAWWVGIGVLSHWVFDWITHRPDLPLWPGSPTRVGLGLWNSPAATVGLESALFLAGLGIYVAITRARGWPGHASLWSFVALVVLAYLVSAIGPPPRDPQALAVVALSMWIMVPWAHWIDRTRLLRGAEP